MTATLPLVVRAAPLVVWRGWRCWQHAAASQPRGAASSSLIGVLWILAVHRRQHSNRWRRWRTWLAHAVCSCHVPQLQNAPPPPPQHPTSDEGHSWRRSASSEHHGTGIVDGILCILCRCRRANMFQHQRLTLRNFSSRRKCNSRKPASLKTSNHAQNISVNIRHFSSRRK